jgi:hypothetical protein
MASAAFHPDLWTLVRGRPQIDPHDLVAAIEAEAHKSHDFRTRLLIRDSIRALEKRWGREGVMSQLSPVAASAVEDILKQNLGEPGFPTIEKRIMQRTDGETLLQFLRELGDRISQQTRLEIGGSGALILQGLLRRYTDDLDAVDEIPAAIRGEHNLLNALSARYGLRLAHFQSHYLPQGWNERLRSLGRFGYLDVYLVDEYDILLGKLFSNREKDLDDLRVLFPAMDRATAIARLGSTCASFLAETPLRGNAERNWYILFGEKLPD